MCAFKRLASFVKMRHASPLLRRSTHLAVKVKGQMYAAQLKNQARKRASAQQ